MINIPKKIETGQPRGLYNILMQLQNTCGLAGIQGRVYFVECNAGKDSYNADAGRSWDTAYKTLEFAIARSNEEISVSRYGHGRGWAARNTIFLKGDACDEDLTTGATKCDIIGVGSCDAMHMARLDGAQAFTGLGGCGFYNLEFVSDDASAVLTFTNCDGITIKNCVFTADHNAEHAILIAGETGGNYIIENNLFRTDADKDPFDEAAIEVTALQINGLLIKNNIIEADIGIRLDGVISQCYIDNNVIKAVTLVIDDNSADAVVTNNYMISAGDGTNLATVFDATIGLCAGNVLTSSNGCIEVPVFTTYA